MIVLDPEQDIQAVVERSPEGSRFYLQPGVYRQQTIHPKNGQEFIGQEGAILSGAMELTIWNKEFDFWYAENLPPPLPSYGGCAADRDLCDAREDLFFNDRLYARVGSFDKLRSGTWHYADGRAYLADDPGGQAIELSVTPLAIGGEASDVVLRNLVVEKYASLAQHGAIEFTDGHRWHVTDVIARWNHGVGLTFGPGTHVEGGSFSHNGHVGLKGTGVGATIEHVEIAFNNYAGYDAQWEAGGTKFYETTGLVVRKSCIHHNYGPGLWTDIDNIDVTYEGNIVFLNENDGIKHEISHDAIIRDNIVSQNGNAFDDWLWGSQILIQNSRNVEVYNNIVEISAQAGNGISIIHQDRDGGKYGPWNATDNYIHDNTVTYLDDHGHSGLVRDTERGWRENEHGNIFDMNKYIVTDEKSEHWRFDGGSDGSWNSVRKFGHERNGELIIEQRTPMKLSCDR